MFSLSKGYPKRKVKSTMHVFAISWLHIALIAGILVALFRVFKIPRGACAWVVVPLIWIYTYFTGFQASAVRSTIMMTIIIVGWSLKRPSNLLNSLGAAALIILLYDPQQLFQASFQLSFFVVLSLALFVPVLEQLRQRLLAPDPFLPPELRPEWRKKLDMPVNFLTTSLVTSLAAWLGSIPLVAYYFHLFTPVSLVANIVVVPLSSCALASNLAGLMCGDWLPGAGEIFNHAAWGFMKGMVAMSEWSAHWSPGSFHIPAPGPLGFLIYYTVLIGIMAGWFRHPRYTKPLIAAVGGLSLLWIGLKVPECFTTRVTILPMGGGDAIFVDNVGHRDDWLIDCGDVDPALHLLKPFLQGQGVNCVHHLVLTHGDVRHVGGAEAIRKMFGTPEVCRSPVRFRSSVYRSLREKFANEKVERIVKQGDKLGSWEVLHPPERGYSTQADENAMVLRGTIRGTTLLLLSDLGKPGQNVLAQNNTNIQADVVISGIPIRTEPVANLFLDLVQPKLIIITDALFPAQARASSALKERLARKGIPAIYTSETGAVTLELKRNAWRATTVSGLHFDQATVKDLLNASESKTPPHSEPEE
jgi:competence protein ComEC